MSDSVRQQIVISGVGGQGVLFVTRLLAEAAIDKELPVFTSETHGMAQRGGTVLSHLKVGGFASPLIRPGQADGLLVLRNENMAQHGAFLKSGGWTVVNSAAPLSVEQGAPPMIIDADALANEIGNPKSVNLILLGYALSQADKMVDAQDKLFCSIDDMKKVLANRFGPRKKLLDASVIALEAGYPQ
jgi:indolepyruvate ferredoxin oxidoreductase beta subunit